MNVYIYAANVYCEDCGKAIREQIIQKGNAPKNIGAAKRYSSDDFPKGPYFNEDEEYDSPQHCGAGDDCLNAIEFPDGCRIGVWLENELTADGVEYVREAIREGGEVADLWAAWYRDYNLTT